MKLTRLLLAFAIFPGMSAAHAGQTAETAPSDERYLIAQSVSASDSSSPSANSEMGVAASAEKKEDPEKKDEKKPGWWRLALSYNFEHNLAKERKYINNTVTLNPSFTLPWGTMINITGGFFYYEEYDRPNSHDVPLGYNDQFDATPITLGIAHRFKIDEKFTGFFVTPALNQAVPYVGVTQRRITKHYYSVTPNLAAGFSKWGVTISNKNGATYNAFGEPWAAIPGLYGEDTTMRNAFMIYSNTTSLGYSYEMVSLTAMTTWSRSWLYPISLDMNTPGALPVTKGSDIRAQPKSSVSYAADLTVSPLDYLSISAGISTAGPEMRQGGFQGRLYPLDPMYTTFYVGIEGSYGP